jgi:hypothetical protein
MQWKCVVTCILNNLGLHFCCVPANMRASSFFYMHMVAHTVGREWQLPACWHGADLHLEICHIHAHTNMGHAGVFVQHDNCRGHLQNAVRMGQVYGNLAVLFLGWLCMWTMCIMFAHTKMGRRGAVLYMHG